MRNIIKKILKEEFDWVNELSDEPFHKILIQNDERDFGLKFTNVDRILFNPPVQIGSREFNDVAFWLEDREFYPENLDFNRSTSYIEIVKFGNLFGKPPRESWDNGHFYDKEDFGRYRVGPVLSDQELYKLSQENSRPNWNGNIWYEQFMREFRRSKG